MRSIVHRWHMKVGGIDLSNFAGLSKVRKHLVRSDLVIVVVGSGAHNALGVEKEVTIVHQKRKLMFQIQPSDPVSIRNFFLTHVNFREF